MRFRTLDPQQPVPGSLFSGCSQVPRTLFGSSGHLETPAGLLLESFLMSKGPDMWQQHGNPKVGMTNFLSPIRWFDLLFTPSVKWSANIRPYSSKHSVARWKYVHVHQ